MQQYAFPNSYLYRSFEIEAPLSIVKDLGNVDLLSYIAVSLQMNCRNICIAWDGTLRSV